MTLSFC